MPADEQQKAQQTEYSPGSARCYPSRLARLPDREALDERYRCENAAEERRLKSDDLIQQTRAADAAQLIVGLTYSQSLMLLTGTIFGLLTLIAAFAAVLYAKRAAEAAEKGLAHGQKVAARELRAWVAARVVPKRIWRSGNAMNFEYDVFFHNHGKTVASRYVEHYRLIFPPEDEPLVDAVHAQWAKWQAPSEDGRAALMPGEEDVFPGREHEAMDFLPWGTVRDGRRLISPIVVISMLYRIDFDEEWHRTDRAFLIRRRGETPMEQFIEDDLTNFGPDELIAQPVSLSLAT